MNVGIYGWKNTLPLNQIFLNISVAFSAHLWSIQEVEISSIIKFKKKSVHTPFFVYIKIKNDVPLTHDVFKTLNAFFFPITSALHYFSYPQRLTVSFNVCEHHQVNHNIFTLSSPAQAKVNLPLVHYRHDTGIPPPSVPQEKVGM